MFDYIGDGKSLYERFKWIKPIKHKCFNKDLINSSGQKFEIGKVYTTTGQLVDTQRIVSQSDLVKLTSSPGVYLLQVSTSTEIFTTKIIITE